MNNKCRICVLSEKKAILTKLLSLLLLNIYLLFRRLAGNKMLTQGRQTAQGKSMCTYKKLLSARALVPNSTGTVA